MRWDITSTHGRLTIWHGDDGPLALPPSGTGVEFRGRLLGHPSSYGLLAGEPALATVAVHLGDGRFPARLDVPGDEISFGLSERDNVTAINDVLDHAGVGLRITAVGEGRIGSSSSVFGRLALVLAHRVGSGSATPVAAEVWREWNRWPVG